uniref:Hint domain-containing protein n=2 Tax=Compsopogon caeruleus TaxID=31354 RepID=A0A7S1T761_9RHOD|mmetsp:Transcript_12151/g.24776  ORF Transcript_12151/g.24776 Transcript_12151/m.24776 type:complete len:251 (+) Transcript_12151:758-1510(+)
MDSILPTPQRTIPPILLGASVAPTQVSLPTPVVTPSQTVLASATDPSNQSEAVSRQPSTDNRACFPGDATVELRSGQTIAISELDVGASVRIGKSQFAEVFFFSHRSSKVKHNFVSIHTNQSRIALSGGHLVPQPGGTLAPARSVQVGDRVMIEDGSWNVVTRVEFTTGLGLYNPHTRTGTMVVNGFVVSCYTDALNAYLAHFLLLPERVAHRFESTFLGPMLHRDGHESYAARIILRLGSLLLERKFVS